MIFFYQVKFIPGIHYVCQRMGKNIHFYKYVVWNHFYKYVVWNQVQKLKVGTIYAEIAPTDISRGIKIFNNGQKEKNYRFFLFKK